MGEAAATTPGKRSLAMESFAAALRAIPATICDNAGASWQPLWHRVRVQVRATHDPHVVQGRVIPPSIEACPGTLVPESFAATLCAIPAAI